MALWADGAMGVRRNSMLAALVVVAAASAHAVPIISVDTDPVASGVQTLREVGPGDSFRIDVVVEGITEEEPLIGYEFDLLFDTTRLALGDVWDAGFLPDSLFFWEASPIPAGVHVFAGIRSLGWGAVGDGVLVHVELTAGDPGESPLVLDDVTLYQPFSAILGPIIVRGINGGAVTVVPEPATGLLLGLGVALIAVARRRATSRA